MTLWNDTNEMWGTICIRFPITYASVVHSTWLSHAMWRTHAPTFNKWHTKNKNKNKVTLHILTYGAMWGCKLTSLKVCINDKFCDIRERIQNVTIWSEIWTMSIRSLGLQDIRECETLYGLILRSLGCNWVTFLKIWMDLHQMGNLRYQSRALYLAGCVYTTLWRDH